MTIGNPHTTLGGKEAVLIMLDKTAAADQVISSKIWLEMALIKQKGGVMTDFCEYIYCKGEFSQPLTIYEKLDFKKLTREKIPFEHDRSP